MISEKFHDTKALHRKAASFSSLDYVETFKALRKPFLNVPDPYFDEIVMTFGALLQEERYLFELPDPDEKRSLAEDIEYRNLLRQRIGFFEHKTENLKLIEQLFERLLATILPYIPPTRQASVFSAPFISTIPHPNAFLNQLFGTLYSGKHVDRGIFSRTRQALTDNICRVSGSTTNFIAPADTQLSPVDAANAYFGETVFGILLAQLFVPLNFPHEVRFNHWHALGGTGAGKTTLLENLILHDLKSENRPALVIVDSQGDLIRKVSRLALMEDIPHVLISPKDTKNPPALNIFDVNRDRLGSYDDTLREQVTAGVIQTFDYLFSGLVGADLTAKQGVFFKYVARLMLLLPETLGRNATIIDMLKLMEDMTPYLPAIRSMPDIPREWFERDFSSKTFAQTKEQIRYRLHALIENPTLARLFTSPHTKVDLFNELNRGSVILVDTAKDFLKGSSANFGQIFISLVLQAVLERAAIPEAKRTPAFLIVDEAAEYFDQNIDDLLTEARKFKLGCLFAHQYLDQASPALRASFAANTGIKFASGVSTHDARALAADMRTTPEFILSQPSLQFAAYIRGVTPNAVSIPVQPGMLDSEPQLSEDRYRELVARNRARVSADAPNVSTKRDDEDSYDW